MKIISNPKSKKRKLVFLFTTLAAGVISTISLVACSSIDYNPKELDKGAAVYSKTTEVDKKPYVQINLYGYEDFTFGNWYPTYTNSNSSTLKYRELIIRNSSDNKATVDPEFPETGDKLITIGEETDEQKEVRKRWGLFVPKYKWIYNNSPIYNSLSDKQKDSDYLVDALEQKQEPDSQKFISLIKTDEELKSSLRLDEESKNLYLKYLESITEKSTLENVIDKNAFLEKNFLPWSNTFNYDAIKSKLDLKKYDYIFIKDLARYFHTEGNGSEYFLDGGLEISNYEVDKNSKEISISWDYKPTAPKDKNLAAPDIILTGVSKRSHSFLLPVEKGGISDFKVDDWSFKKIS
ncbi:hypothetical protein ACA758_03420 [Mycoplasmopsis agassizii]|uniref:hypothetical protein n=1 Tax=Mycoplasmopsis agassizii TaxID=33922 RepID=UPI003529A54E